MSETENEMLRCVFGAKREPVTREWRILSNEELYILKAYTSL
jgi:hypothetical protein